MYMYTISMMFYLYDYFVFIDVLEMMSLRDICLQMMFYLYDYFNILSS